MDTRAEILDGRFSIKADAPSFDAILDDKKRIIDYQNVKIEGYANTFNLDRGGDKVVPGAFMEHLEEYLSNPILLVDHVRDTEFTAGKVEVAYEDNIGLKIIGKLSNSPSEKMRDLRFKVAEGVLKTFSIGGRFHGSPTKDVFFITKIELREVSIVTVPMNKESLFEVKHVDDNQTLKDPTSENTTNDQSGQRSDDGFYIEIDGEYKTITQEQI